MRKKIKEIMNKEEGFTLVELLAVIVILGIIVAIAVPSIGNIIEDSRTKADAAEKELVVDAARLYFTTEVKVGKEKEASVTVEKLKEKGYLDVKEDKDEPLIGGVERSVDGTLNYSEGIKNNNPEPSNS